MADMRTRIGGLPQGLAVSVVLLTICACGASPPPPTPLPTPTTAASPRATPLTAYPPVVQKTVEDLARVVPQPASAITVVTVEEVEWPDASLGCPQPGHVYAQVVTPGYRVTLAVGGQQYDYHTDRAEHVIRCRA